MARVRRLPLPKSGIAPNGIKYAVKYDRDWQEWQVRAYKRSPKTGAWKFAEGPTYYAGGGSDGREDAIETFHHLVGYGPGYERANPRRKIRRRRRNPKVIYFVQAQGYGPGPAFATKGEVIRAIQGFVREDVRACRRKFGAAFVERRKDTWEVRPVRYSSSYTPMWSRYSALSVVSNALG
jgi:hypothetical protein